MPIVRDNPYTYATEKKKTYKLEVEFCLDQIPGPWNTPQDLMEWICRNSYVKRVVCDTKQFN